MLNKDPMNMEVRGIFNDYQTLDQKTILDLVPNKRSKGYGILAEMYRLNSQGASRVPNQPIGSAPPPGRLVTSSDPKDIVMDQTAETREFLAFAGAKMRDEAVANINTIVKKSLPRNYKGEPLDVKWAQELARKLLKMKDGSNKQVSASASLRHLQFSEAFTRLRTYPAGTPSISYALMKTFLRFMYEPNQVPKFNPVNHSQSIASLFLTDSAGYWTMVQKAPSREVIVMGIEYLTRCYQEIENGATFARPPAISDFETNPQLFLLAAVKLDLSPILTLDQLAEKVRHYKLAIDDVYFIAQKLRIFA